MASKNTKWANHALVKKSDSTEAMDATNKDAFAKLFKIPKAVQRARDLMEESGAEVNADTIKANLTPTEFNSLCSGFRQNMAKNPQLKKAYTATNDAGKRQWIAQYVLDPEACLLTGTNTSSVALTNKSKSEVQWLTFDQLAGPDWFASKDHATIVTESGDLEERDHELPSLAKKGVKQWKYQKSHEATIASHTESASVSASCELKPDEYDQLKEHMHSNFEKTPNKRKLTPKPPAADSEAKKQRREANNMRSARLRKLKTVIDSTHNQTEAMQKDLPNLKERGYPPAMFEWAKTHIENFYSLHWEPAQDVYTTAITYIPKDSDSVHQIQESTGTLDQAINTLESMCEQFNKGTGSQIKKLIT